MTSAEPARTAAYTKDIAVWQRLGMNMSFKDIARRLQIGVGTAFRLYKRFVATGEISPPQRACRPDVRKLNEYHELYIMSLLIDNPGLYLSEICLAIKDAIPA